MDQPKYKVCIPFRRKLQALTRKCQVFSIIFTVSGFTAVRSDHGVMSYIPDMALKGLIINPNPFTF